MEKRPAPEENAPREQVDGDRTERFLTHARELLRRAREHFERDSRRGEDPTKKGE